MFLAFAIVVGMSVSLLIGFVAGKTTPNKPEPREPEPPPEWLIESGVLQEDSRI